MRVVTLLENSVSKKNNHIELKAKHGLSFYVEKNDMKILFDVGPDDTFIKNAIELDIDLKDIDYVFISHGHKDHGGGLKAFFEINSKATVYIGENAFDKYYYQWLKIFKLSVGLDSSLKNNDRIKVVKHGDIIADELHIIANIPGHEMIHGSNSKLLMRNSDQFKVDDFKHEINVMFIDNNRLILITGCAHKGIINIVESAIKYSIKMFGNKYIYKVIGGFHLMDADTSKAYDQVFLNYLGEALETLNVEKYHTCHCTGEDKVLFLKERLQNRLVSINTGDQLTI